MYWYFGIVISMGARGHLQLTDKIISKDIQSLIIVIVHVLLEIGTQKVIVVP